MILLSLLIACTAEGPDADSGTGALPPIEGPPLVVNEFLAKNDTINADEASEFDDWVEIYNNGDETVTFENLYLTDNLEDPTKWALPAGEEIEAGGFALVWCDGATDQGDMHTSFKLSGGGEDLAIFYVEEGYQPARLDAIQFESQTPDVSSARKPDGSLEWVQGVPTPDASNG